MNPNDKTIKSRLKRWYNRTKYTDMVSYGETYLIYDVDGDISTQWDLYYRKGRTLSFVSPFTSKTIDFRLDKVHEIDEDHPLLQKNKLIDWVPMFMIKQRGMEGTFVIYKRRE